MNRIIHGEFAIYHTQTNNRRKPARACGRTSIINALRALYDPITPPFPPLPEGVDQYEDALDISIVNDPECKRLYATKPAAMREKNPISEWQDILALGTNRWLGKNVARFNEYASTQDIINHVIQRGPCIVTGYFPAPMGKTWEHSVALIGLEYDGDPIPQNIWRYWIRDPRGDHRTLYRKLDGKLVDFKPTEFKARLKSANIDRKWSIFLTKE